MYLKSIRKRDLCFASYLFASCNFCRVGVVGFKARSDTFHVADRLERIRGIYWLRYRDLGCEDSILFSLSPSLSLHLNLDYYFSLHSCLQVPVEVVACRSARRHLSRAFLFGQLAMCPFLLKMHDA